jgi:hypothetical protein
MWGWLSGRRLELAQRRAQRVKPRGMRKPILVDGAPDCRRQRSKLIVAEVNCRLGAERV